MNHERLFSFFTAFALAIPIPRNPSPPSILWDQHMAFPHNSHSSVPWYRYICTDRKLEIPRYGFFRSLTALRIRRILSKHKCAQFLAESPVHLAFHLALACCLITTSSFFCLHLICPCLPPFTLFSTTLPLLVKTSCLNLLCLHRSELTLAPFRLTILKAHLMPAHLVPIPPV